MLTTFFNMESDLYYELFTSFIGKGDKESFAYALAATHSPYSVVPTPVGSVGQIGQVRHAGSSKKDLSACSECLFGLCFALQHNAGS